MADKSEFVDLISEATQQNRRRVVKRAVIGLDEADERRLSNWPPGRCAQWRLENLTPWKLTLRPWKFKDWV